MIHATATRPRGGSPQVKANLFFPSALHLARPRRPPPPPSTAPPSSDAPPGREARTDRAYRVHPRRPPPPTASVSPVLRADPPSLLQLALPILSDSAAATPGALLRAEELQEWFVRIAIQVWLVRLQEGSSSSSSRSGCRCSTRPLISLAGVHGERDGNGPWPPAAKAASMHCH